MDLRGGPKIHLQYHALTRVLRQNQRRKPTLRRIQDQGLQDETEVEGLNKLIWNVYSVYILSSFKIVWIKSNWPNLRISQYLVNNLEYS